METILTYISHGLERTRVTQMGFNFMDYSRFAWPYGLTCSEVLCTERVLLHLSLRVA